MSFIVSVGMLDSLTLVELFFHLSQRSRRFLLHFFLGKLISMLGLYASIVGNMSSLYEVAIEFTQLFKVQ